MLDEKDLQAIGEMMDKMLDSKLDSKLAQHKTEIFHDVKLLLDTEVTTKFNLLAEELSIIKERLPVPEDLDAMQDMLDLHHAMLKQHTREIQSLKKAN